MGDILSIGSMLIDGSSLRAEAAARNIVHSSSSGYRREIAFERMLTADGDNFTPSNLALSRDHAPGAVGVSSRSEDLAIEGQGFFVLSDGDTMRFSRNGAFRIVDGRLVDGHGWAVQAAGGGDLRLGEGRLAVAADGLVTSDEVPTGRIAIMAFDDMSELRPISGDSFAAPAGAGHLVDRPLVRQGMLEGSNVNTGDEMVRMMEAVRSAETGQRIVQLYDELLGRALTAFGGN